MKPFNMFQAVRKHKGGVAGGVQLFWRWPQMSSACHPTEKCGESCYRAAWSMWRTLEYIYIRVFNQKTVWDVDLSMVWIPSPCVRNLPSATCSSKLSTVTNVCGLVGCNHGYRNRKELTPKALETSKLTRAWRTFNWHSIKCAKHSNIYFYS